jgi:hypothetical protein
MTCLLKYLLDGAGFDNFTGFHHRDPVTHMLHHAQIMGDKQHRKMQPALQRDQ